MEYNLAAHSSQLLSLLNDIPVQNNYKSSSELNRIFSKYLKILDFVNSYNSIYKSVTGVYYSDITNLRDNIHQLLTAETSREKDLAFERATNDLRTDLHALSILIKPQKELAV